jgi:2-(1,2-epoxy-1,2-dihydrophenyl)acetyl-CoA isomerase
VHLELSMSDLIAEARYGPIVVWTLDRAERLNALPDLGDGEAFASACERVNADPHVRCVVLTGAGRAFSAGGDLKAMRDRRDLFEGSGLAIRERYRRLVHRIVRSLYGLEVPLIAAVNGPAMGLGCDIAGLADLRVASDRASFGVPFLKLGIIPGDGGAWLLPRNVGYVRAAELLFTGRSIDAHTALAWGLVNRVVGHDDLMEAAMGLAGEVAAQPPQALRLAKALLRQGRDATFDQILEQSAALQALAHLSADHAEGVAAVIEKRAGVFGGE